MPLGAHRVDQTPEGASVALPGEEVPVEEPVVVMVVAVAVVARAVVALVVAPVVAPAVVEGVSRSGNYLYS
jgi:hypothetical protein